MSELLYVYRVGYATELNSMNARVVYFAHGFGLNYVPLYGLSRLVGLG